MTTLTNEQKTDIMQTHAQRYAREVELLEARPDPSEKENLQGEIVILGKNATLNAPKIKALQSRLDELNRQEAENSALLEPIRRQKAAERMQELEAQEGQLRLQLHALEIDLNKIKWTSEQWKKYEGLKTEIENIRFEMRKFS